MSIVRRGDAPRRRRGILTTEGTENTERNHRGGAENTELYKRRGESYHGGHGEAGWEEESHNPRCCGMEYLRVQGGCQAADIRLTAVGQAGGRALV